MLGFFKSSKIPELSCRDALEMAQRCEVHLIDVRETSEWTQGHIEGAASAPLSCLDVDALPVDKPIAFLCLTGRRSASAARQAMNSRRICSNVAGGMSAWRDARLPMTIKMHAANGSAQ